MEKISKKKSLGQHFLHSAHYLKLIADTAQLKKDERVLEVGPGDGALTRELLARGARVLAVEKDQRLISVLEEKFAQEIKTGQLEIIEADILDFDPKKYFKKETYKVVANIPYYISGALFKKFLSSAHQPSSMTLLIQKEVAERIAREKKESILSLSVKAYGTPKYVKTVPAGAFSPPPKVDSAILALENISRKNFSPSTSLRTSSELEKRFFELVRAGFAQKRKLLRSNLAQLLGEQAQTLGTARAEDVALEKWLQLAAFR